MSAVSPAIQERRKSLRGEGSPPVAISLLQAARSVPANSVNFSEGGLCLRVQETLEVRSLVRLRLTPAVKPSRPLQCTGRVMWVVQRLDLRTNPPFLFDVGIEFVDPPPLLRQFLARQGGRLKLSHIRRAIANKTLAPVSLRGRQYVPCLERAPSAAVRRWHLVVSIDGVPCFSEHYASERTAVIAWGRFKRQQARGR